MPFMSSSRARCPAKAKPRDATLLHSLISTAVTDRQHPPDIQFAAHLFGRGLEVFSFTECRPSTEGILCPDPIVSFALKISPKFDE